MEIRVPVFAGRRILKKESLWDIRDYTYAGWQLYYAEYTDGLLKGCDIRAEDGRLVIGKGMLKFHDFIYLLMEEEEVTYQPKNRWQVLKAEFLEDDTNLDYKAYRVRFFLDEELELGENQMEMCRFYLREGSALRDSYKNFADMSTEYDTVNLICATVAGMGEKTLHPVVVKQFGEELWNMEEKDQFDFGFCSLVWNTQGRVERKVIAAYLSNKMKKAVVDKIMSYDNQMVYEKLENIVDNMGKFKKEKVNARVIIVD
ncbi:hypothetical protein [Roseburia sp.]|jgi:hypothetical protein|uniref:hypothetical protein n=1 Tax=Roseburia sp. TaxID=2049040 RepID=UPI003522381F